MENKLILADKKKEFYTDEVLFRYNTFGRVATFIDLDNLGKQFKEVRGGEVLTPERFLEILSSNGIKFARMSKRNAVIFNKETIDSLEKLFDEDIIHELEVNLRCINQVKNMLKDIKVYVLEDDTHDKQPCITMEDLGKLTFSDNFWTNIGSIMFDLSTSKKHNNKKLTIRYNKVSYVTPSGVRAYCQDSGVADSLMVDDIIHRMMEELNKN